MLLVLIEHDRGVRSEASLEAVTVARSLDDAVQAVVIAAPEGADLTDGLGEFGVSVAHVASHPSMSDYAPTAWGATIAQLATNIGAAGVVAAGTERGNEVMAHVGAITGHPMVANCTELTAGDQWEMTRIRWGGSLLERASLDAPLKLVTVAPHMVEPKPSPVDMTVESFTPELDDRHVITQIVDRVSAGEGVTLATAPVVVSGGRGMGSAEAFGILEELADLVGGVVGCSRVATNNGWRSHRDQVGQTGTVVAPDLYIACGISGAIQHWVGMMNSKKVLAINTDSESSMVMKADYAIIGDVHEVIPAVTAEIKRRRDG